MLLCFNHFSLCKMNCTINRVVILCIRYTPLVTGQQGSAWLEKKITEIDSHLNQHNIVGEIIFSDEFELNDLNPSKRITVIYHQLLMWKKLSIWRTAFTLHFQFMFVRIRITYSITLNKPCKYLGCAHKPQTFYCATLP